MTQIDRDPLTAGMTLTDKHNAQASVYAQPLELGDRRTTEHLYAVEVEPKASNAHGRRQSINVNANNRNQAAAIAKANGFVVCSVNMIG